MGNLTNYAAPCVEIERLVGQFDVIEACPDCLPWALRIGATRCADVTIYERHAVGCRVVVGLKKCHPRGLWTTDECPLCGSLLPEKEDTTAQEVINYTEDRK